MRNYHKELFQIKMTGLSFIMLALFAMNNSALAKVPYVPVTEPWPEHMTLREAVDNIRRLDKNSNNRVEWVGGKSSYFEMPLFSARAINATPSYSLQNIDNIASFSKGNFAFDIDVDEARVNSFTSSFKTKKSADVSAKVNLGSNQSAVKVASNSLPATNDLEQQKLVAAVDANNLDAAATVMQISEKNAKQTLERGAWQNLDEVSVFN